MKFLKAVKGFTIDGMNMLAHAQAYVCIIVPEINS